MINVYSDNYQSALNYLKNTKANLHNILIMASDFNIRDSDFDSSYPFHSVHSNTWLNITDLFGLKLSCSIQQISTWYSDNVNNTNSVINLFFPFNQTLSKLTTIALFQISTTHLIMLH